MAPLFIAPLVVVFFIVELAPLVLKPAVPRVDLLALRVPLLRVTDPAPLLVELPVFRVPLLLEAEPAPLRAEPLMLLLVLLFLAAPLLAPPSSRSEAFPPRPFAGDTARSAAGTPRLVVPAPARLFVAEATPFRFAVALFVRASSFWFGFALPLGLLVEVAILGSFICADFAIPILVPSAEPRAPVTLGFDDAALVFALLVPAGADFNIASRDPEADFTLPAPVITAEGLVRPPRALALDFTGFIPGLTMTCSVLDLRVVACFVGAIISLRSSK